MDNATRARREEMAARALAALKMGLSDQGEQLPPDLWQQALPAALAALAAADKVVMPGGGKPKWEPPVCPYCGKPAEYSPTSSHLYRKDYGPVWQCVPCEAWVGCHPPTKNQNGRPQRQKGRLAKATLRKLKIQTHDAFGALWRAKMERDGCDQKTALNAAYDWLAKQLGIDRQDCHIGEFDENMCQRVIDACAAVKRKPA